MIRCFFSLASNSDKKRNRVRVVAQLFPHLRREPIPLLGHESDVVAWPKQLLQWLAFRQEVAELLHLIGDLKSHLPGPARFRSGENGFE